MAQVLQIPGPMNNGYTNFKEEAIKIRDHYSKLKYMETEGLPYIFGELELKDGTSELVDSYFIRIQPTSDYPRKFPHVFETCGRIPKNIDWHIFDNGRCCIKSIPEEILICKQGISLNQFIKDQVEPYFFNQKYRELNGYFLNERSHGVKGNIEFFEEVLGTKSLILIKKCLVFIRDDMEPNRVSNCFCGSGKKYRKCHQSTYRLLRLFTNSELDLFIKMTLFLSNNK